MMHFVTRALKGKTPKTEEEWHELVRRHWSMECTFNKEHAGDLLATSWSMGDIRFEAADLSGQRWTWIPGPGLNHWRSHYLVVLLIESGEIEMEQDGTHIRLREGSLVIFDGSNRYTQTSKANSRAIALRVAKASLENRGRLFSRRSMFVPNLTSPDVELLRSLIEGATAYGENCSDHNARLVADYLTDLLGIATNAAKLPVRLVRSDVMLGKIKRFIDRNVGNEHIDIAMVASAMGVSKRHLNRLFEREGSSVMRYVLQQRLAKATEILTSGDVDVRISDIAWQCGFVSAAHFSRVFRKHYGKSPTEFQRCGVISASE
jgi:AraC-like DNA-binding protein/quercetin dioxygenase-like cupin family protein